MLLFLTLVQSFLLSPLPMAEDHDFHISKVLVEYNEPEKALQVSMHLFIDDLEEALRVRGKDSLFICTSNEAPNAEQYMAEYIKKNFELYVDGEKQEYSFLGKEIADDMAGVWCYLEALNVNAIKELKIKNSLLLELFDDQKNIVSVIGPQRKKGVLLLERNAHTSSIDY